MDNNVKKENINASTDDINGISSYNNSKRPSPIVIDNTGVERLTVDISKTSYRKLYPWEEEQKDNLVAYGNIQTNYGKLDAPKASLTKAKPIRLRQTIIYRQNPGTGVYGDPNVVTWNNNSDIYKADGAPVSNTNLIMEKFGTFSPSNRYRNTPLVFVVGGIFNSDGYPGDATGKPGSGYMWKFGFNNLRDFHVYVCKTQDSSGGGWAECVNIASRIGVTFTRKILVGFSGGAGYMYSGVLSKHGISNWDIVHIVGPAMSTQASCDKHLSIASGKVYYIQDGGPDKTSELADSKFKTQLANKLDPGHVITVKGHSAGAIKSAEWIKTNIILNTKIKVTSNATSTSGGGGGGVPIVTADPAEIAKLKAKYKGQITEYLDTKNIPLLSPPSKGSYTTGRNYTTLINGVGVVGANNVVVKSSTGKYGVVTYVGIVKNGKVLRPTAITPDGQSNGRVHVSLITRVDKENLLEANAAKSFLLMKEQAAKEGINLWLTSGYRPIGEQLNGDKGYRDWSYRDTGARPKGYSRQRWRTQWASWYNYKFKGGAPAAEPGSSNHGDGRAIDLDGSGKKIFPDKSISAGKQWVMMNGWKWGWYWGEIVSEDWHFTWIPNVSTPITNGGSNYLYDEYGNFLTTSAEFRR